MKHDSAQTVLRESVVAAGERLVDQTFQAQITGIAREAGGGVIPNVKITATNIATGVPYTTEANGQGIARLLALPPARYNIAAAASGFKAFEQGPIPLQVNDVVELDIVLQVGDATKGVKF